MNFQDYDAQARSTMIYPGQKMLEGLAYTALGLGGEAGETVDIIKKIMRANSNWARADPVAAASARQKRATAR